MKKFPSELETLIKHICLFKKLKINVLIFIHY